MECIATGLPAPSVQWKRVNKSSHQNRDATSVNTGSSNLQISSVSVRDQGEYLCVISGGGKTIMKSVYLFVKGKNAYFLYSYDVIALIYEIFIITFIAF